MGVIKRGVKNAFRNVTRTVSIVLTLGLSIGLALTMLVARQAVQERIDTVKSSTGNTVSVSPAGMRGFEGGGDLLTATDLSSVSSIPHVSKVVQTLSDRLRNGDNTTLESSLTMGSFGSRQQGSNDGQGEIPISAENIPSSSDTASTTPPSAPINLTGVNSVDTTALAVSSISFTSGESFDATKDENVAIVGQDLATKNSLSVGSTFTAYSTEIKVVGIYDTGNTFTNSGVAMPITAVQRLTSQTGQVSSATVVVDSIDNLSGVKTEITTKLGDKVDVTTSQDSAATITSQFDSIKNITFISLIGSLCAGAVIILLTMMMIARERRREIGVLKAIGATDSRVISQFAVESLTLTFMGSVIGLVIGVLASSTVMNLLVTNSTTTASPQMGPGGGFGRGMMQLAGQSMNSLQNIQTTVGWDIILYGISAALLIAIVGSVIPAWFITKIRPAEVMRAE